MFRLANLRRLLSRFPAVRAVLLLATMMVMATAVTTTILLTELRQESVHRARSEAVTLTRALSEQTTRAFEGVTLSMQGIKERLSDAVGMRLALDSDMVRFLLLARSAALPQVKSIFVVDDEGFGVNSSRPDFIRRLDVSRRSFYLDALKEEKGAPVIGDPNAPMTIVTYSDFQCPYCARFATQTWPTLVQEYIDSGKAKMVFKDFPLEQIHPNAQKAAEAARCVRELAGPDDAFWAMHDVLFANQESWGGSADPSELFAGYAGEAGVADAAAFGECLSSGRHAEAVQADLMEGLNFGVRGTPTFFLDGQALVGAQPIENFRQAIAMVNEGLSIAPPPQPTPAPEPTPAPLPEDASLDDAAATKGDPNAPVVIVEYSDYQCPFCQRHFAQVWPELQQYIDDGTVLYVFKDFPLTSIHPQAPKAAEAARCAGDQEAYWAMHDMLFQNQQQWSGQATAVEIFKGFAGQLGLDQATFDQCLDSDKHAAAVEANLQQGAGFGVRGTPGFFVNRVPLPGAYPIEAFQQLIQQALQN